MGLDISAYSNLQLYQEYKNVSEISDEIYDDENKIVVYKNGFDRLDGMKQGVYQKTKKTKELFFNCGSYGTYNSWRYLLSSTILDINPNEIWINFNNFIKNPFVELIHFSDCEGVIGPKTSEKLYKDFKKYYRRFKKHVDEEWDKRVYRDFMEGFKIASKNGFVIFH